MPSDEFELVPVYSRRPDAHLLSISILLIVFSS